jgi:D-alanyl-D-alanine carboxypeptidase (penicillin-binding protein 5/6)
VRTASVVAALAALGVWLAGSGAGIAVPPRISVVVRLPRVAVAGPVAAAALTPALPWPKTGQSAVDIPAIGFHAQSGPERPVPVASMTKVMTAYVVLHDHPLALGAQGPSVTISAADASQFGLDTVTDQANVVLRAGEVLTEYQMLEGLLVHSANDLAYALACWDAGSLPAFVAKMNATAALLGMRSTHFADASGFSASSVSTASDLLKVAAAAMTDPVFAQIVSMPAVSLPLAGVVASYTPLLGSTGVVGVKSGFTSAAGGGDILAYRTSVDGHSVLSLAAVTSQEGWTVLDVAGKEALALARAASAGVQMETMAQKGTVVAQVVAGRRAVDVVTASSAELLVLPGDRVRQLVHVRALRGAVGKGTRLGSATFMLGSQDVSVPVRLAARVP